MKNFDFRPYLLIALAAKAVLDGGSFPIAIIAASVLVSQAYSAFLGKQKDFQKEAFEDEIKSLKDRIGSMESKMALTMGTNRLK